MTVVAFNEPRPKLPTRIWNWLAQWAEALDTPELTHLETRIRLIEVELASLRNSDVA